jgi:hypothetical protein
VKTENEILTEEAIKKILTKRVLTGLLERIGTKNSWGKNELIRIIAEVSCEVLD